MTTSNAHNFFKKLTGLIKNRQLPQWRPGNALTAFIKSWWHVLTIGILAFAFLYYPLGSWLIHHIDKTTDYEITRTPTKQSATIETAAFLINREVNDKLWTPNLPFFYPSFFLDDMPNFQLGIIDSLAVSVSAMAHRLPVTTETGTTSHLQKAAELLNYPGTVWMFSPDNKLLPAPSSTRQYREARRQLIKYNKALADGSAVFHPNADDLVYILERISRSLQHAEKSLSAHIREHSTDWYDTKADNIFYLNQGKAYGYYLMLKALGTDYQTLIVDNGQYENWTKLLGALREAVELSPSLVRNAELDSIFAPNHLNSLGFYILKAQNIIYQINAALAKTK